MKACFVALVGACLFSQAGAAAQPYVPDELADWQRWVLQDEEFRVCPRFFNRSESRDSFICSWAEPLQLVLTGRGGRFDLRVQTFAETWVALPGDLDNFPQAVRLNNRPALVAEHAGQPALWLPAGEHSISGRFDWSSRPDTLRVPDELALLTLNVDGEVINNPERRGQILWLGERKQPSQQPETLDIEVYRLLADDIPMRLETLVRLRVAGGVREALLGRVLPPGFVPVSLRSRLPARIEPDGRLRLQLQPGSHELNVSARASEIKEALTLQPAQGPWAASEIWSYQDNPRLRVTNPSAASPVDPNQVEVPGPWRAFPAFNLRAGETLRIEERGRGVSDERKNRFSLDRELWLDFDGGGLTARDWLSGEMRERWRLDMAAPFVLQSAESEGDSLLITQGATPQLRGIELRSPSLNLEASSRVSAGGAIPVSGWNETMQSMSATLNLPPGFMLLAASGVNETQGAWVERWKLLDFFLLLVIAVAVRRLYGNLAGIVALAALVFTFHEPGAPVWSWLNLVVALALAGAVSKGLFGRLAGFYRSVSFLAVLVLLLPFVANQARLALFPQLESTGEIHYLVSRPSDVMQAQRQAPKAAVERRLGDMAVSEMENIIVTGAAASPVFKERYDPDAQVQTGSGLASWAWRTAKLNWDGPVEPDQTLRLFLLHPWQTALWRVFGAVLGALLFYLLLRANFDLAAPMKRMRQGGSAVALAFALLFAPWPADVQAEVPPQAVLDELKSRLTAAPECVPVCATVPTARVDVTPSELAVEMTVHASENVAIPLPGHASGWRPFSFSVNDTQRALLYRDSGDTLWLKLDAGIHTLRLAGPTPPTDSFQVPFPLPPRTLQTSASGWELSGVRDQRLVSGAIELIRIRADKAGETNVAETFSADRFPTFVEVSREIVLGLDWSVRTQVRRVAPVAGAINLEIPLLQGESVISANVPVRDGKAVVAMAPQESVFTWQSTLNRSETLALRAPTDRPWTEIWAVLAGQSWHVEHEGTPLVLPEGFPGQFWVPEFYPRPGEILNVTVKRPQAADGETLAFDKVEYSQSVGSQHSSLSLNLYYRSTRGQQHVLTLPTGAELEDVSMDGQKQQLRLEDGRLVLPILPGSHALSIGFRLPEGVTWWREVPAVKIDAAASNLNVALNLPQDRWVLLTSGPRLGPAVLYWAELAVFLLFAWLLGTTTITPLKRHDWLLLGLGFSTFSWGILMMVAAWLFILGWRARNPEFGKPLWFNLRQLILAVLSIGVVIGLVSAIPMALLGNPDMHVVGNGSSMHQLRWFSDRSAGDTPVVAALSAPMWLYKLLILLWSLWLSFALVRWLPWAWNALRSGGTWAETEGARGKKRADETQKSVDSG